MRFLTLELDGRTTLDRTRQGLYGVVMGQHPTAPARPALDPAQSRQIRELRRRLLAAVQRQSPGVMPLR
jgi:hypothetical protein